MLILRRQLPFRAKRQRTLFLNQRGRQRIETPGNQLPASVIQVPAILSVTVAQFLVCLVPILEGGKLAIGVVRFNIGNVKQDPAILTRPFSEALTRLKRLIAAAKGTPAIKSTLPEVPNVQRRHH